MKLMMILVIKIKSVFNYCDNDYDNNNDEKMIAIMITVTISMMVTMSKAIMRMTRNIASSAQ